LYRSRDEHAADCDRHPFADIPSRVFLDTNVINLLVKQREFVFEQRPLGDDLKGFLGLQAEALMHLFQVGSRAGWTMVASARSLIEIGSTFDEDVRRMLLDFAVEIVEDQGERALFANALGRRIADAGLLNILPDVADRELLGNAIALECDVFCTCDRKTIISKRARLPRLPLRVLTPAEWWAHVRPWAGLWA
jgi:hypothetical protein